MSKWGDRFVEHQKRLERRVIEVPEMKDEEGNALLIHTAPVSVRAGERILEAWSKSPVRGYVEAMVLLARTADGERVFTDTDRVTLLDASKDMIERVGGAIIRGCTDVELGAPFEAIVKNSEADPSA